MRGQISLANGLMHLRIAQMYFSSFATDNPGTKGARLFGNYSQKIEWIIKDLQNSPFLPEPVRIGIKRDMESDVLVIPALVEKIALLTEENRLAMETLVEGLIKGEKITVEKLPEPVEA
jgi:hypothetical protein